MKIKFSFFSSALKSTKTCLKIGFLMIALLTYAGTLAQDFSEDFENGIPSDWGLFLDESATQDWTTTLNGYQSDGAAILDPKEDNIGEGNTGRYFLVTPNVTVPEDAQLRFWSHYDEAGDENTTYRVMISTAPQPDINDFIDLESWTAEELEETGEYVLDLIDLPTGISAGIDIYLAFVVENTQTGAEASGTSWTIDDVLLTSSCSLLDLDEVEISAITIDSADISWEHPDAEDFEIQIVEEGETIDPDEGESVNAQTYTANGLEEDTAYDVYIKSICSDDIEGEWQYVVTFTTLKYGMSCDSPIEIGDSYSFEGSTMDFPNSFDIEFDDPGSNCLGDNVTENFINGNKIFFSYTATEDGMINIDQMTLPFTPGTNCYGNTQSAVFIYENCDAVGEECSAAVHTSNVDQLEYINNFPVEAGETYIIVISTTYEAVDASVCFEFNLNFTNCPTPTNVEFNNIAQTSAAASWSNPGDIAESWEYVVQPLGSGTPDQDAGTSTTTNENVLLDNLDEGTDYELYVRSICSSGDGDWGLAFPFTTQCGVKELPYFASLDDADPESDIDCWSTLNANDDDVEWEFQFGSAHLQLMAGNGEHDDYLISPQINLDVESLKRIRFDYQSYEGPTTISLYASSTGSGANDFTQVIVEDLELLETGWDIFEEKIITIPEEIDEVVNIAFHVGSTDPTTVGIDFKNISIEEMPACSDPLDPWVNNITEDTADIGWTEGFEEDQWEVYLSAYTDSEPTAEDEGIIVDDNEYTLEDLEPGTQYKYYVRAYCNEDEQSEWIGPVVFNTTCNTVALEIPFEETFEDDDPDTNKFCWTILNESGVENIAFQMDENSALLLTPMFGFDGDFDEWLISPGLSMEEGTYEIKFDYRAPGSMLSPSGFAEAEVLVSTTNTDPSSFTEIQSLFSFDNSNYETKSVYYELESEEMVYFAIHVPNGANVMNLEIGNFKVDFLSECPKPTDLTIEEVNATSVEVSWEAGFNEDEWELAVQPFGTGTPTEFETVDETTWVVDGLDPLTEYEVYVRTNCGEPLSESDWVGPEHFTTLCETTYTTPFIETFEETSESRDCWIVIDGNEDGNFWHLNSAMNPYEGELSAGAFTGTNGANDDWLISPTITVEENQRISFYYSVMDGFFVEDLKVLISTDGVNPEDFTTELFDTGEAPINNEDYKQMVLDIPEGITGDIHIAFHVPQYPSIGTYRGQSLFIDNVEVKDAPACADPINPEIISTQDETATVDWEVTGEEEEWEVAVIPEAEVEDPENIDFESVDESYIHHTTEVPFEVDGLDPAQRYYVAVKALCEEDLTSDWSEIIELITVCDLDDQCEYTIILYSDSHMGVGGGIDVIQNEVVIQTLEFPTGGYADGAPDPEEFIVYFCNGTEFSLFWDSVGTAPDQYPEAWVKIEDEDGNEVFDSGPGIGTPRTTLYSGFPVCGDIDCPQPENIEVDENMEFTWEPIGNENQWEVAIKPVDDGTLPLSGTIVDTPNYTPTEDDFADPYKMTHDFYVRAVCEEDSESHWRGPYSFVRGDIPENAVLIPVNEEELCLENTGDVSFRNAHQSTEEMTCESEEVADVWFEFEATSRVHIIEVNGFTGNFYTSSGDEPYPNITTTLYKDEGDGELAEMRCSENNVIVASYSSELEVGETYKVRLTLNDPEVSTRLFDICITTPENLCEIPTVNGDFERPGLSYFSGVESIGSQYVVPNWRKNMETELGNAIFIWEGLNSAGMAFDPYSGNQCVQLVADDESYYDESDPRGIYTDMETSEMKLIDYSFANAGRNDDDIIQLYAGPVDGPFELVHEQVGLIGNWTWNEGTYEVPEGQDETRFMFVSKNYAIGNLLDKVNFIPNNKILSTDESLDCDEDEISLEANGYGEWLEDEDNPAAVEISDPTSNETSVSGFSVSGEYTFIWKTRYCEETVTITYEGLDEVPAVETPIEYCQDQEVEALYAEPSEDYELVFFAGEDTEPQESIIPSTEEPGVFTYYAAYISAEGCMSEKAEIEVIVEELIEPEVEFFYDDYVYCLGNENPTPFVEDDFSDLGEFTVTPSGLAINPEDGTLYLEDSEPGVYEITYAVAADIDNCQLEASYTTEVEILPEIEFELESYCDGVNYMIRPIFSGEDISSSVEYTWEDESGHIIGTDSELDFNSAMSSAILPVKVYLTIEVEGCIYTEEFTVTSSICKIPEGISPNGDGYNDSFDLSGMGVKELIIYSRYGNKVYSKKDYNNEWEGQGDNGKALPSGTYYYVIKTASGENLKGWVYLNQEN